MEQRRLQWQRRVGFESYAGKRNKKKCGKMVSKAHTMTLCTYKKSNIRHNFHFGTINKLTFFDVIAKKLVEIVLKKTIDNIKENN